MNLHQNIDVNIPSRLRDKITISSHVWGDFFTSTHSLSSPYQATALSADHPHRYTRIIAADTYWIASQHVHLARSMLHFLSHDEKARVLTIAGFHTGRKIVERWFRTAEEEGLEVEEAWEEDGGGLIRGWMVGRKEGYEESKKWLVLAVLKRRVEGVRLGSTGRENEEAGIDDWGSPNLIPLHKFSVQVDDLTGFRVGAEEAWPVAQKYEDYKDMGW